MVDTATSTAAGGAKTPSPESALIARILAGERELFHQLIRPCERSVYFAAYSILENEFDAEDVAQETVLKAFKNLATFRGDAKFSTWLVSIAINEARARLRHARVLKFDSIDEVRDEEDGEFVPEVLNDWREVPSEALERKEVREMLQSALASLPEKYREVLVLRDVQEFNIADTANMLGVNQGIVKTRLLRARLMMQKILAPQLKTRYAKGGLFGLFQRKGGGAWF